MGNKRRALRTFLALISVLATGCAWLASAPDAVAGGWGYGYHGRCCYWGYPYYGSSVRLFFGFPFGFAAPAYYPPPYPVYAYPPPQPYYAYPPPPPRQAGQPRPFIVYFAFDRSTLTPQGAQVIDQAIAQFHQSGSAQIQVTGYTDAAGTRQYDLALSQRRAATVRDYMVRHGVPSGQILVSALGKDNPRVPTVEGVPEQQNRRVEIVIPTGPYAAAAPPGAGPPGAGGQCQRVQSNVMIDGKSQRAYGQACRQPDGSWRFVS